MQTSLSATRPIGSPLYRFRKWLGGSYTPYLFVAPFFILFGSFGLYPLISAFRLSLTSWRGAGEPRYIGFANYTFLLSDDFFWGSLKNSLILWFLIVPGQAFLAILIASILSRQIRFRAFFRVIFMVPYLVPLVAIAQVWLILFDKDFGTINAILQALHLPPIGWLTTETWAKPTLALLVFWKSSGFAILVMLAAIQNIPLDIYESASLDGANGVQQFLYITVPLVRRSLVFFMIIATLGILQMFAEPYVLTGGGPYNSTTTAGYALYRYIRTLDLGTGAANSFLLMIVVLIFSLAMLKMLRTREQA